MHLCVYACHVKTCSFKTPQHSHTAYRSPIQLTPPPTLPPGALRQRAEWSRAVRGDSDIHRMQWIINEHHLVHTTGEHSSNRWLQDVSLSFSLSLCQTRSRSLFRDFFHLFSRLSFHTFPTYNTATQLLSRFLSSSLVFLHLLLFALSAPPPPFPMLLRGLSDRLVMVSLILIQLYKSQTANKVTCCPLKDIHFHDL